MTFLRRLYDVFLSAGNNVKYRRTTALINTEFALTKEVSETVILGVLQNYQPQADQPPPTTDHQPTNRFSTDAPTHWPYCNKPPTLLIGHSHWVLFITEFVKLFKKWLVKKDVDKLQVLLTIPFGIKLVS